MGTTTKVKGPTKRIRWTELKNILEDRQSALTQAIHDRIRDARTDSTRSCQVLDEGETSEVDIQDDIEFALIQMKSDAEQDRRGTPPDQ